MQKKIRIEISLNINETYNFKLIIICFIALLVKKTSRISNDRVKPVAAF
jgi:hypothetical protein